MSLPADLERFATEAVAAGRYRSIAELVAAGIRLVRHQEQARADFTASLHAAEADSERDGFHTIDDVHAEMAAVIAQARHTSM